MDYRQDLGLAKSSGDPDAVEAAWVQWFTLHTRGRNFLPQAMLGVHMN